MDVVRGPEVKMTFIPTMKILIRSTGRSQNLRRGEGGGGGIKNGSFSVDHVNCGEIPVTKLIPVGVLDTEEQLVMRVSTITSELSQVETSAYSETDINDSPVIRRIIGLCRHTINYE